MNDEAPAGRGEWLSLFVTGLGPTRPPLRAGEVSPASPLAEAVLPVRVDVADQAAEVAFAGMVPGMAGVGQVNFRIAGTVEAGRRPLRVCVAAACSNVVLVRVR